MLAYNKHLKFLARELRKNMTDAEKILWSRLRCKQFEFQFYRQKIIGNYIADFYCPKAGLIIELDGRYHEGDEQWEKDKGKDIYFQSLGLKVLRFKNLEVFQNLNDVIERIYWEIELTLKR